MAELRLIQDSPQPHVIQALESLLAQAKSGELQTIVYVCDWRANSISHGWSSIKKNRMRIIGELEQVKWHLLSFDK